MFKRRASKGLTEEDTRQHKRATIEEGQPLADVQPAVAYESTTTTSTKTRTNGLAFRISNIPSSITEDQLLQILNALPYDTSLGGRSRVEGEQNLLGWSFAPSVTSADAVRYRTATVTFKIVPIELKFPGTSNYVNLVPNTAVIADTHFHGLTPLNYSRLPTVDIIAVTGLAGHGFGSWKARGGSVMWLRDFLPEHVPNARIMIYGYDSMLFKSNSTATIREFSRNFLQALNTARASDESSTETLFELCHNLVTWDSESEVVRFVHLSVQEYLECEFNPVGSHSMAAECCLSLLVPTLSPPRRESIAYSTEYWHYHVGRSYSRDQRMSRALLDHLKCFLGTPAVPGQAYCNWIGSVRRGRDHLANVISRPLNPLFTVSYFPFGEELHDHWEFHGIGINCRNHRGKAMLCVAAMRGNEGVIKILLGKGADLSTGYPLMVAIRSQHARSAVLLFDAGAIPDHCYTGVLEAATVEGNEIVVRAFMDRDPDIEIKEAVLIGAAKNGKYSTAVLEMLLAKDLSIEIKEAVLIAAAENRGCGVALLEMLLARDPNIEIKEAVLIAAAKNGESGTAVLEMLLARDPDIEIREAVVIAVMGNWWCSAAVLEMLLARGRNIEINEAVLIAAAEDWGCGAALLELLLARDPNIEIKEAVLIAAAENRGCGVALLEMLLARDPETRSGKRF